MPEPAPSSDNRSPFQKALARFARRPSARVGLAVLTLFILAAVYAPFIGSEVALVWMDDEGMRFPLFGDLFNRNSYGKPHHLLFNVMVFLIPVYIAGWWASGRFLRWSGGTRLMTCLGIQVLAMVLCWVPMLPQDDGTWEAVWSQRPTSTCTYQAAADDDTVSAVFALVPHSYSAKYYSFSPPLAVNPDTGRRFLLGTDDRGGDVFVRMIFGARISLTIGLVAVGISMFIGVVIGAVSGYFGGWVDLVLQRLVEIMLSFPTFVLVLVVVAMFERDIYLIMVVFGLTGWAGTARLVRGEFLAQSGREYVLAGQALGLGRMRIMFRHILPNILTPLMISATFGIAGTVLAESGLAFIGLGDDKVPSWGSLLDVGRQYLKYYWLIWVPGAAIFALVSSLNMVGNALRDAFDPRVVER